MNQLSQISEGGFSDIITDVDTFIEENGMTEDVGCLLQAKSEALVDSNENEEECKPAPAEFFGAPSYPLQASSTAPAYPPDQPTDLCTEEYPGALNFEVYVIPNEHKTPWEYSAKLNKIFIGINLKFPVAFSVKTRPHFDLFIRATPVFTQAQFFQETVRRCIGHQHLQDPTNQNVPEHVTHHIVRCTNEGTHYCGNHEGARLNLVLPLAPPKAGTDTVREFFQFVCKNSCPSGMNRRPIEVIFTLEDQSGRVLGRRIVAVRICSCPKRDREKEEKDLEKNRGLQLVPQAKRRRLAQAPSSDECDDVPDTRLFPLNINLIGKNNYLEVLRYYKSLMALEIVKHEGRNNGADAPFRKCYNDVTALLNKSMAD